MRLTLKKLNAMANALVAILAGEEGAGDAGDIPFHVYEDALAWVQWQIEARTSPLSSPSPTQHER